VLSHIIFNTKEFGIRAFPQMSDQCAIYLAEVLRASRRKIMSNGNPARRGKQQPQAELGTLMSRPVRAEILRVGHID